MHCIQLSSHSPDRCCGRTLVNYLSSSILFLWGKDWLAGALPPASSSALQFEPCRPPPPSDTPRPFPSPRELRQGLDRGCQRSSPRRSWCESVPSITTSPKSTTSSGTPESPWLSGRTERRTSVQRWHRGMWRKPFLRMSCSHPPIQKLTQGFGFCNL